MEKSEKVMSGTDRDGRHRSGGGSRRLPRLVLWFQKRPFR
jgi:hypothetical protein